MEREWKDGDTLSLSLAMPIRRVLPPTGAENADQFADYQRGPVVLAADKRITDPAAVWKVKVAEDGSVGETFAPCPEIPEHKLCRSVELENGDTIRLIDYASAGKPWTEEARIAAWLRLK